MSCRIDYVIHVDGNRYVRNVGADIFSDLSLEQAASKIVKDIKRIRGRMIEERSDEGSGLRRA